MTACPPHSWTSTKLLGDVCRDCGTTFRDHVGNGPGTNVSNFEMPSSKVFRRKRKVRQKFGRGLSDDE